MWRSVEYIGLFCFLFFCSFVIFFIFLIYFLLVVLSRGHVICVGNDNFNMDFIFFHRCLWNIGISNTRVCISKMDEGARLTTPYHVFYYIQSRQIMHKEYFYYSIYFVSFSRSYFSFLRFVFQMPLHMSREKISYHFVIEQKDSYNGRSHYHYHFHYFYYHYYYYYYHYHFYYYHHYHNHLKHTTSRDHCSSCRMS